MRKYLQIVDNLHTNWESKVGWVEQGPYSHSQRRQLSVTMQHRGPGTAASDLLEKKKSWEIQPCGVVVKETACVALGS
jgi:hypothetical protein